MPARQMRRGTVKLLWIAVLLATIHYPLITVVLAHADYERSVPAADEVVDQSPQQVQVWFTQELFRREGQNSLEVYGPDEQRVDLDDAAIDDDDRKLMTVSLQADLADGVYIVRWRTLSADDGDDADGEFRFTVRAGNPASEADTPTAVAQAPKPSPTNTTQPSQAVPEATPTADSVASEDSEASSDSENPALPCVGSSAPLMLLLGAFLVGRGRRHRRNASLHPKRAQER